MSTQTFLVRLWSSVEETAATDDLRGILQHSGSADPQPFRSGAELIELLKVAREEGGEQEDPPTARLRSR